MYITLPTTYLTTDEQGFKFLGPPSSQASQSSTWHQRVAQQTTTPHRPLHPDLDPQPSFTSNPTLSSPVPLLLLNDDSSSSPPPSPLSARQLCRQAPRKTLVFFPDQVFANLPPAHSNYQPPIGRWELDSHHSDRPSCSSSTRPCLWSPA
ncbi:hypothetical protein VDGL01_08507 [Verticillium dahliae]